MSAFFTALPGKIARNTATRYGAAVLFTMLAVALRWALGGMQSDALPYVTLFPAVAAAGWLCEIGPSVLAMVLGLAGVRYVLYGPERGFATASGADWTAMLMYAASCIAIIAIGEVARRENTQMRTAQYDLEQGVRERTAELDAANRSLRQLSARLLKSQDEERRRIARELHDSVGQTLAALAMNLRAVGGEIERLQKTAKTVGDSATLVSEMSTDLRTISYLLHPPLLDEAGLGSALRWFVDGFVDRSGIKVDLEAPKDFARLPQDMEIALFRVVQEGLTNIHRHSGSAVAKIRLVSSTEEVRVEVADEGKGITEEQRREILTTGLPGVGLRGMRERLRQLGGTMEIGPGKGGSGTLVVARLPLQTEEKLKGMAAGAGMGAGLGMSLSA
jgi:signal transduction histidine kinase